MLSIWNKEWRADKEKTGIIEQAQASWQDTIALYRLQEENIIGDEHENPDVYDKLCVVLVGLGKEDRQAECLLINMLKVLLRNHVKNFPSFMWG